MADRGDCLAHEVRLLGPWELRDSRGVVPIPAGRLRILLTSLVLSANQAVRLDTLAEQLWPEQPPVRVRDALHILVVRLRKLLGPGVVHTQPGGGYRLAIAADAVDLHRFRTLLRQANRAGSSAEELTLLREALALWRGNPFADLYSTWLDREVAPRLTEEWFAAVGRRIELELATERPEPLIAELWELVDRHPTREFLWQQLITALNRAGRRAEALDAFQRVRAILREELGIEPGAALVELQRMILLDGGRPAATTPSRAVPRQLPHDIARFVGRDTELATLNGLLTTAESTPAPLIVAIDGAPGIGKTTLAVHWAHRVAHRYPDAQLYLNLRGYGPAEPLTPLAAAEKLLRALGVDSELIPPDERFALLRSTLAGRHTLILFDNARDIDQIRPLLPGGTCLVIVTSRSQLRGLSIQDTAHRVTLRPMPSAQSIQLLAAVVGSRLVAVQPVAATALAELCGHLPLALAIVAERAYRAGTLTQTLTELENEQTRLSTLDTGEDNPHTNLRAALSWSYRALTPNAAAMFRRLGLHVVNDIEVQTAAVLANIPIPEAQAALDQLVAAHLAEQRRPNRYELHDLIRLYAAELAAQESPTERYAAVRRVLTWYLHAASNADRLLHPRRPRGFLAPYKPFNPPPEFATPMAAKAWLDQEYECLRAAVCWAARHGFPGYAWRISVTMTTYFDGTIPWRDGLEFYRHALAAAERSGETVGEAYTLNSLGRIYLDMGDPTTAKSHFERSHARFRIIADRFGQAMTLENLALAHGELGEGEAARGYSTRALELHVQLGHTRGIAQNVDNLGVAHLVAGEYEQAVECFQNALTMGQIDDREFEAWTRLHLARAYSQLANYPSAIRSFRRAVALYRTMGNRRREAICLADLGATLADAGHPGLARTIRRAALTTLTEFADPRAAEIEAALAATP